MQSFIKVRAFICDTPAKNSICGVKGHNGYSGCGKCNQTGVHLENRMTFPELNAQNRTNKSFREKHDKKHHKYDTPIEELENIDMINQFPIDYLHNICLGVTKKLIWIWLKDAKSALPASDVNKINDRLITFSKNQPKDFQRKIRSLSETSDFKGSLRNFFPLFCYLYLYFISFFKALSSVRFCYTPVLWH